MRESKTANHFVKYMVSNLSENQSQLQDQVRQISRAVATLAADLQGMHQKDPDASTLRRVEESIRSKLTKTKSSKSLDAATAQTLQVVTVAGPPSPENGSQLPTLLQRLDDGHGMEVQAMPDETRPSMSAILQLLQDCSGVSCPLCLCDTLVIPLSTQHCCQSLYTDSFSFSVSCLVLSCIGCHLRYHLLSSSLYHVVEFVLSPKQSKLETCREVPNSQDWT